MNLVNNLIVLAMNAKLAYASFHYTECGMTNNCRNEESSIIWIWNIRMSCKHTRVWIQDTYKKGQLFWQKRIERPPYSLSTVLPW